MLCSADVLPNSEDLQLFLALSTQKVAQRGSSSSKAKACRNQVVLGSN